MREIIEKILKESDVDYWKDYAESKKQSDERKANEEDGILGKLLADTRMDKNRYKNSNFQMLKAFDTLDARR